MINASSPVEPIDAGGILGEIDIPGVSVNDLLIETRGEGYSTRSAMPPTAAGGVLWENLPDRPSVRLRTKEGKFRAGKFLSFIIDSDNSTGDVIGVAIRKASDALVPGWLYSSFVVNWSGKGRVSLSFASFSELLQDPSIYVNEGVNQAPDLTGHDEIALFSGLHGMSASPITKLKIEGIAIESGVDESAQASPIGLFTTSGVSVQSRAPLASRYPIGHSSAEFQGSATITADYSYTPYSRGERADYGYYPSFIPGPVSISPDGTKYILGAGHLLQWRNASAWSSVDLIDEIASSLPSSDLFIDGAYNTTESAIRFDVDGDIYILMYVAGQNNSQTRTFLLLHSADLISWSVYSDAWFDGNGCRFEKHTGQNGDCLLNPPVVVNDKESPDIMLLSKTGGVLDLSKRVSLGVTKTNGLIPMYHHSGEGSSIVSIGDDVFITYGLTDQVGASGVEAYVCRYNRITDTLYAAVKVGEGGVDYDDEHNWPVITCDHTNTLHVVMNGHHDPFAYSYSLNSDGSSWSVSSTHSNGTSYLALVCDSFGTLYAVSRESSDSYFMRLTLHKKPSGQPWTQSRIISPSKSFYRIWYHKLVINPLNDNLFLFYHAHSLQEQYFEDELKAEAFRRPGLYYHNLDLNLPSGSEASAGSTYATMQTAAMDPVVIMSDDGGTSWRLAISEDFD